MKKIKFFIWAFTAMYFLYFAVFVFSLPQISCEYYGNVSINDSNANVGSNISVYDSDWVLCGFFNVSNNGYYGSLSCNGDDNETNTDEGALNGETIHFLVNSERAVPFGNRSWVQGEFRMVNLSAKNYAPYFEHNLTDREINETDTFDYDINCSDINYWQDIYYYTNSSFFGINLLTGIINFAANQSHVGNNSIKIICSDGFVNISSIFNLAVHNINNAPVLASVGNKIAVEGELFEYNVTATDTDGDNLTYYVNNTLFTIGASTGKISFTPTYSQIGNHSINISVSDGLLSDFEIISFRIVRGPYCGDGSCASSEDCSSCSTDCGTCPAETSTQTMEEAAEAEKQRTIQKKQKCIENWECTDWSECYIHGFKDRDCVDVNKCGTESKKPSNTQSCEYIGNCFDGLKNNGEDEVDCGGSCKACHRDGPCYNGIQDNDETGVDCGGSCKACELEKFAKLPSLERFAPSMKKYPGVFLVLICSLLTLTISGDNFYVRKIRKNEFAVYRKKMLRYKKIRKVIYTSAVVLSAVLLSVSLLLYYISDKKEGKLLYVAFALILITAIVGAVPFIVSKFKYHDYKKSIKEKSFLDRDKKERQKISRIENESILSLEIKAYDTINNMIVSKKYDADITNGYGGFYEIFSRIIELRKYILLSNETSDDTKKTIVMLCNNNHLKWMSKEYNEFLDLLNRVNSLNRSFNNKRLEPEDVKDIINEFNDVVLRISKDKHLLSVIMSDKQTIEVYNSIVDVYRFYNNYSDSEAKNKDHISELESRFKKKLEAINSNLLMTNKIKSDKGLALIFNSLVDLYNHYQKKNEFAEQLKQNERNTRFNLRI